MFQLITALSFAAFALAVIGVDAAQSNIRIANVNLDSATNTEASNLDFRVIADGKDDYPSPEGDGDDPDIRFPGDPRAA
jgi:hypothetical protein